MVDKFHILLTVLGAAVIVGAPVFVWKLLRAPYLLYAERDNQAIETERELRERVASLETRIANERVELLRRHAEAEDMQAREILRLQELVHSKTPNLTGSIENTIWGASENTASTIAAILATVRNTGEPSIAHGWAIYAHLPDGRRVEGEKQWIDHLRLFEGTGATAVVVPGQPQRQPTREITAQDALYNKAMTPIPKGGVVVGWLVASFPGVAHRQFASKDTKIVVEFKDVLDRPYSCSQVFGDNFVPLGQSPRFPGEAT